MATESTIRTIKMVNKILENVPQNELAVTAHQLSQKSKVSLVTVQKWLEIIFYIQEHHIQVNLMQAKSSGTKTYRLVKRKNSG